MTFHAFCPAYLESVRRSSLLLDEGERYFVWKALVALCGEDRAALTNVNQTLGGVLFPPPYPNTGDAGPPPGALGQPCAADTDCTSCYCDQTQAQPICCDPDTGACQ